MAPAMLGHEETWYCADKNAPNWGHCGDDVQCGAGSINTTAATLTATAAAAAAAAAVQGAGVWMLVDVKSKSLSSVSLDLSRLPAGAAPLALRYAWDNDKDSCCQSTGPTASCPPAACPIYETTTGLPGNPFMAKIENGKCQCVAPQVCG